MTINSIFNGSGTQPINISDTKKSARIGDVSRNDTTPVNATGTTTPTDTLNLTGTASLLRSLEQQLATQPIVDVQRVDAVKREIANGTYDISPPQIADKMIQMEMAINQRLN